VKRKKRRMRKEKRRRHLRRRFPKFCETKKLEGAPFLSNKMTDIHFTSKILVFLCTYLVRTSKGVVLRMQVLAQLQFCAQPSE
jgi:hypothetical protein